MFSTWIVALTVGALPGLGVASVDSSSAPATRTAHLSTGLGVGLPRKFRTRGVFLLQARASRLADIAPAPRTVLIDSRNEQFDLEKLRGKVVVVSFIYTTCNGSCPLTTQALVRVQKKLDDAKLWGKSVEFVSITLDPERDTAPVLEKYARLMGAESPAWHFLTGAPNDVARVIKAWDMWVKRDATGVLDHPSRVFLIDRRGRQREIYNLETLTPEAVLEDSRGLLAD